MRNVVALATTQAKDVKVNLSRIIQANVELNLNKL